MNIHTLRYTHTRSKHALKKKKTSNQKKKMNENFNPTAKDLGMVFTRFVYTSSSSSSQQQQQKQKKKFGQNKNNQKKAAICRQKRTQRKKNSRINIEHCVVFGYTYRTDLIFVNEKESCPAKKKVGSKKYNSYSLADVEKN